MQIQLLKWKYKTYFHFSVEKLKEQLDRFKYRILSKEEKKESEADKKLINSYKEYMQKVLAVLVYNQTSTSPITAEQNATLVSASHEIFNITRFISKLNNVVENMNKSMNPLDDMIDLSFAEIQNYTNVYVQNYTHNRLSQYPFWEEYIGEFFAEVPEVRLNFTTDKLLTSKMDLYYLEHIFGEIITNKSAEILEMYVWWDAIEELLLHTTNQMRSMYLEYIRSITKLEGGSSRSYYCTNAVNQLMGMALSYGIADKQFLNTTKPNVQTMLVLIQASFKQLVRDLPWMDSQTKIETLEKAEKMKSQIGFPDWILNTKELENFYKNVRKLFEWLWEDLLEFYSPDYNLWDQLPEEHHASDPPEHKS